MAETREGTGEADLLLVPKYEYLTIGGDKAGILSRIRSLIAGFTMVPHAQAWADACSKATGATSFGTYNGHDPTPQRAIDAFSPVPGDRKAPTDGTRKRVLGDDIAEFSLETLRQGNPYGVWYLIWRQHIYNPSIANYWRYMDTRANGDITQNHFDHVHHSFNETASGVIVPSKPTDEREFAMSLSVRYVWGPNPLSQTDWVFDGPSKIYAQVGVLGVLKACDKVGMVELGKVDTDTHNWFSNVAAGWQK